MLTNELPVIAVGILATWRITSLLISEDGPFSIFARLRDAVGVQFDEQSRKYGTNEVAKALTCIYCASIWVGLAVSALQGNTLVHGFLMGIVYSAGAIIINKWIKS